MKLFLFWEGFSFSLLILLVPGGVVSLFLSLFLMSDTSMFISWIKPLCPLICRFMNSLLLCVSIPRLHYFVP